MRVLFLSKRYPQQRDLLARPYGRFYHLPTVLANRGHDVRVVLASHHGDPSVDATAGGVTWICRDLRRLGLRGLLRDLHAEVANWLPDWIIGCSDAWVACLARHIALRTASRLAIDAYDDFESYMPWNLPLHWLYRRALRHADLVTAAGPQLATLLDRHRTQDPRTAILPMAADPSFVPMDRGDCRRSLGLPADAPILGYYGGWGTHRGTDILVPALRLIRQIRPDVILALTGRPPAWVVAEPGVISLGYLDDAQLPRFVNALNVGCITTADSSFGRGSYPAKLCEAMACGIAVVATETEPVRWMLSQQIDRLVPIGDAVAYAEVTLRALELERVDYGRRPDWRQVGADLEALLASAETAPH